MKKRKKCNMISKLRDQVQQISFSQKVTEAKMDNLKKGLEAKINSMKDNIEHWKKDMEGWKEGLTKLLQERLPNGKDVVEETHNENKRNVNHDSKNDNIEDLKKYMEYLKEGLTKLLQERLPNDEKIVEEAYNENKRNVNHFLRMTTLKV